jgi:hypothetical protein
MSREFIVKPTDESQAEAIIAFMKALKIKFKENKMVKEEEAEYNPEFVAKINKSRKQYVEGKFKTVKFEELDEFLGLK